jgi:hypothetical protein
VDFDQILFSEAARNVDRQFREVIAVTGCAQVDFALAALKVCETWDIVVTCDKSHITCKSGQHIQLV